MSQFPGAVYRSDGRAMDRRMSDMTVAKLFNCHHRWLMRHRIGAPIMQVWLLDDDATVEDVPWMTWQVTMGEVWSGAAILLIAHRPKPVTSLREMALAVMAINEATIRRAAKAIEARA